MKQTKPRLKKRHFVASGSLITIGSGLLSFSVLSLSGLGL